MLRWFGAILIIIGCGAVGFAMAAAHRREERCLRQFVDALEEMYSELQFRMTPLPELCRMISASRNNTIGHIFRELSRELDRQINPEVSSCMYAVLAGDRSIPESLREGLQLMGKSLGKYDLEGQLRGLESVKEYCHRWLEKLSANRDVRLRSYETLGLCAGAALAILLI